MASPDSNSPRYTGATAPVEGDEEGAMVVAAPSSTVRSLAPASVEWSRPVSKALSAWSAAEPSAATSSGVLGLLLA